MSATDNNLGLKKSPMLNPYPSKFRLTYANNSVNPNPDCSGALKKSA